MHRQVTLSGQQIGDPYVLSEQARLANDTVAVYSNIYPLIISCVATARALPPPPVLPFPWPPVGRCATHMGAAVGRLTDPCTHEGGARACA